MEYKDNLTDSALGRVKHALDYTLREKYDIEDPEITDAILAIHGLHRNNFDYIKNFEALLDNQGDASDLSVDTNANKTEVSISGLHSEIDVPNRKIVGYRFLYRKLKELYGKERAKFLTGEMYDFSTPISDSANILKNYCFSIDASKLALQGRPFGQLPSLPPHRVDSYVATLCETLHQLSNHLAGAIAIGTFFLDIAYMVLHHEEGSLSMLRDDKKYRKHINNEFQSFIHSMNHLSRNAVESPFTNISIFDRPKYRAILDEDNMGWYMEMAKNDVSMAEAEAMGMSWMDYYIEVLIELQHIYMEIVDAGDVTNNGRPIRFPVNTINLSRIEKDGKIVVEDEKFLDDICRKEIYRYNVYVSEGMKISSCCRLINDVDLFELGGQVNSFGGSAISLGSHRVVNINLRRISLECTSFDDYMDILKKRMDSAADILIAHRALLKDLIAKGVQPFMENGFITLSKTFSTFGLLGYYEAVKDLNARFGDDTDYLAIILQFINSYAGQLTRERGNVFNIEQIPAETMAVRFADVDRLLFGEDKVPEKLYANQFVPLFENGHSLWERMDLDGKYGSYLTGGGIVHFSLGEKLTPKQVRKIIDYALESGNEYFALNPVYSICSEGHTSFGKMEVCPVCGAPITDFVTRTVGFFVKTSNMSTPKREYDFHKRQYVGI